MLLIESIYPLLLRRVSSFSPSDLTHFKIIQFSHPIKVSFQHTPGTTVVNSKIGFHQYTLVLSHTQWSATVIILTCGSVFDVCAISCFFGRAVPPPISADLPIGQFPLPLSHKHPFHSGTLYFTPRVSRHPCQRVLLTAYYHSTFNLSLANQVAILVAVTTNNRILLFVHSLTCDPCVVAEGCKGTLLGRRKRGELDRKFHRHSFFIGKQEGNTICFSYPRNTKELQSNPFDNPNNMGNIKYSIIYQR